MLNAIREAHLETFEHFRHRSPVVAGGLLTTLHDTVHEWVHLQARDFSATREAMLCETYRELREICFVLG